VCGLDPTTPRRERPIIQHKLYVYIEKWEVFSRGHHGAHAHKVSSCIQNPFNGTASAATEIVFYFITPGNWCWGVIILTCMCIYTIVIRIAYDLSVIYFGSRIIDMSLKKCCILHIIITAFNLYKMRFIIIVYRRLALMVI